MWHRVHRGRRIFGHREQQVAGPRVVATMNGARQEFGSNPGPKMKVDLHCKYSELNFSFKDGATHSFHWR